jgi:hypothetical protein
MLIPMKNISFVETVNTTKPAHIRNTYVILVGRLKWKRPLPRPRRRWEDNIRRDLKGNRVGRCGLVAHSSG